MSFLRKAVVFVLCLYCTSAFAQSEYSWQSLMLRGNPKYLGHYYGGSFAQRADGKMLVTYRVDDRAMLSVVDSEKTLLTVSNASKKNESPIYKYYSPPDISRTALQRLSNGRILLYILDTGVDGVRKKPFSLTVLESANGLGTDFVRKSTVYTHARAENTFGAMGMGDPIEISGRILLPVVVPVSDHGSKDVYTARLYCAISSDGGASWTFSQIAPDNDYRAVSRGFGIAKGQIVVLVQNGYAAGKTTIYSHPLDKLEGSPMFHQDKPVWTFHDSYAQTQIGDMTFSHLFLGGDGYTYFLRDDDFSDTKYFVYRRPTSQPIDFDGQTPYTLGPPGSGATWEGPLNADAYGDDGTEFFSVTPSGYLAFYGTSNFGGYSISDLFVATPPPGK
jgi:hypothetical protein